MKNIEPNIKKKDLSLQLRTGKLVKIKNNINEFVPDIIHISGVLTILEIERIRRNRIKENDSTPTISVDS